MKKHAWETKTRAWNFQNQARRGHSTPPFSKSTRGKWKTTHDFLASARDWIKTTRENLRLTRGWRRTMLAFLEGTRGNSQPGRGFPKSTHGILKRCRGKRRYCRGFRKTTHDFSKSTRGFGKSARDSPKSVVFSPFSGLEGHLDKKRQAPGRTRRAASASHGHIIVPCRVPWHVAPAGRGRMVAARPLLPWKGCENSPAIHAVSELSILSADGVADGVGGVDEQGLLSLRKFAGAAGRDFEIFQIVQAGIPFPRLGCIVRRCERFQ